MHTNVRAVLAAMAATVWIPTAALAQPGIPSSSPSAAKSVKTPLGEEVRALKTHLKVELAYKADTRVEFQLGPGEAALLTFAANEAGVTEFLFHNAKERLSIVYGCDGEPYDSTFVTPERPRNKRTVGARIAPAWMQCEVKCEFRDGAAHVTFLTRTIAGDEVRKSKEAEQKAREAEAAKMHRILTWDEGADVPAFKVLIPGPEEPSLQQLRKEYELDKVVAGAANDYERLRRVMKWVHDRWDHNGDNTPSKSDPLTILAEAKAGKRFRCVEYAIVVTGCAQALGMPARVLGLKRDDVETAKSSAGHLVAEVWLDSLKKWVFVDGQWDAIPEKDGKPLNAVEFQDAVSRNAPGLKIRSSSDIREDSYLSWVMPYLYYFDFNLDQRQFAPESDHSNANRMAPRKGKIMLVPKGARNPTSFQGKSPIRNCTYISSPKAFYPNPNTP